MPIPFSKADRGNPANERQPLLKSRTGSTLTGIQPIDLEAAIPSLPGGQHKTWSIFWFIIFACVNAVIMFISENKGDDEPGSDSLVSHSSSSGSPQFDYKWALWRALGGGLSGIAGKDIERNWFVENTFENTLLLATIIQAFALMVNIQPHISCT